MRRGWLAGAGVVVVVLVVAYGVGQWRLNAWYGRDFEAAFRARIAAEIKPGERLDWPADAAVTRRSSALVQGYVVCGTATVHGQDGTARTARYAVGFSPTPFGAGAKDLYTPATGENAMDWVCRGG